MVTFDQKIRQPRAKMTVFDKNYHFSSEIRVFGQNLSNFALNLPKIWPFRSKKDIFLPKYWSLRNFNG